MERAKKYSWKDEAIKKNIKLVDSFSELAKKIGVSRSMASRLKSDVIRLGLDFSHFRVGGHKHKSYDELTSRSARKKYLLRNNLLDYKCYKCGITDWNDQPIILDLEHIDGNTKNNDISNLILLCPNCHSQTSTFKGRNKNKGV